MVSFIVGESTIFNSISKLGHLQGVSAQGLHVAKVTEATLTYVAIDENRKPKVVRPESE